MGWFSRFALILPVLVLFSCEKRQHAQISGSIHGMKVYFSQSETRKKYQNDFPKLAADLKAVGVNTIFTTVYEGRKAFFPSRVFRWSDPDLNLLELRRVMKQNNIRFAAICQIFYDPDIVLNRDDLIPVDSYGNNVYVDWQKMVCPTDKEYRLYKLSIVKEVAKKFQPDILCLDFMRYPTTWELVLPNEKPDQLREFCFCNRCLSLFIQKYSLVFPDSLTETAQKASWILENHGEKWTAWKVENITRFVKSVRSAIEKIDPNIKILVHTVPWSGEQFNQAILRVAGQDVKALTPYVDYFSPMIYHKMIGQDAEFIHDLTAELYETTRKPILPSIQVEASGEFQDFTPNEFEQALVYALMTPSAGAVVFNWENLAQIGTNESNRQTRRLVLQKVFQ